MDKEQKKPSHERLAQYWRDHPEAAIDMPEIPKPRPLPKPVRMIPPFTQLAPGSLAALQTPPVPPSPSRPPAATPTAPSPSWGDRVIGERHRPYDLEKDGEHGRTPLDQKIRGR